jgi:hypothetical protein
MGWTGRQGERRLSNVVGGVVLKDFPELGDFPFGGRRADQHAVATGSVNFLHDDVGEIVEHIRKIIFARTVPGWHIVQDRF